MCFEIVLLHCLTRFISNYITYHTKSVKLMEWEQIDVRPLQRIKPYAHSSWNRGTIFRILNARYAYAFYFIDIMVCSKITLQSLITPTRKKRQIFYYKKIGQIYSLLKGSVYRRPFSLHLVLWLWNVSLWKRNVTWVLPFTTILRNRKWIYELMSIWIHGDMLKYKTFCRLLFMFELQNCKISWEWSFSDMSVVLQYITVCKTFSRVDELHKLKKIEKKTNKIWKRKNYSWV